VVRDHGIGADHGFPDREDTWAHEDVDSQPTVVADRNRRIRQLLADGGDQPLLITDRKVRLIRLTGSAPEEMKMLGARMQFCPIPTVPIREARRWMVVPAPIR
jgi:hypothetical protein